MMLPTGDESRKALGMSAIDRFINPCLLHGYSGGNAARSLSPGKSEVMRPD